jgi:hypothetical protein
MREIFGKLRDKIQEGLHTGYDVINAAHDEFDAHIEDVVTGAATEKHAAVIASAMYAADRGWHKLEDFLRERFPERFAEEGQEKLTDWVSQEKDDNRLDKADVRSEQAEDSKADGDLRETNIRETSTPHSGSPDENTTPSPEKTDAPTTDNGKKPESGGWKKDFEEQFEPELPQVEKTVAETKGESRGWKSDFDKQFEPATKDSGNETTPGAAGRSGDWPSAADTNRGDSQFAKDEVKAGENSSVDSPAKDDVRSTSDTSGKTDHQAVEDKTADQDRDHDRMD